MREGDPLDTWKEWLRTIHQDVIKMDVRKKIWLRFFEVVRANAELRELPGTFPEWATENYAATQSMTVRRQVDLSKGVISLQRLLTKVVAQRDVLTWERYVRVNFQGNEDVASRMWPEVGRGGDCLAASVVKKHIPSGMAPMI